MPTQVIPIDDIAKIGLMADFPDISLPPNAFSNLENVRLHDNAIRKLPGEYPLGTFTVPQGGGEIIYVAYWPSPNLQPNSGYYVYVAQSNDDTDHVYIKQLDSVTVRELYSVPSGGTWQHTLFGGGFTFILNNGSTTPRYITVNDGDLNIPENAYTLPGWDEGYFTLERVVDETFDANTQTRDFNLGQRIDSDNIEILCYILKEDGTIKETGTFNASNIPGTSGEFTISLDEDANVHVVTASTELESTDQMVVELKANNEVTLTAAIVRTLGDSLIAGNLTETNSSNNMVVRRLTGAVRISDVAAPGGVPTNWNPFAAGVSTADEYILSSTGIVQDIVELQGRAMIYTNTSIHSLTPTGNTTVPFSLDTVTEAYGAHSMGCVLEMDGSHIVIGSNDIYQFSGHPGNIQSLAHGRVRYDLYNKLGSHSENMFMLRHNRFNEIWIMYPVGDSEELSETLIFNYRENTWTRRRISGFTGATVGLAKIGDTVDPNQLHMIFCGGNDVYSVDEGYTDKDGNGYTSFVERSRMEMQPIFYTESVNEVGLWSQSTTQGVEMTIDLGSTDAPGETVSFTKSYTHKVNEDYKTDVRINGRILSYKIGDNQTGPWVLSGIQLTVGQKGRR